MDRYEYRYPQIPKVTRNLMIACVAVFVLQLMPVLGGWINRLFMLYPPTSPLFLPWQPLTYAFLHYDASHILFNLLGLFMFGSQIEQLYGARRYATLLAVSAVVAGVVHLMITPLLQGYAAPLIGASGAVFGLLMAQAMLFPRQTVLFFMVLPMENRVAVAIFGGLELLLGVTHDGVAHFAHLGGMLGAYLLITWWRKGGGRRPPVRRVH